MTIIATPTTWTRANAKRIRAKAWTGYGITRELAHVTPSGVVHLWDECASHWSTCHALSRRAVRRIASLPVV